MNTTRQPPWVSILTPVWNGWEFLAECAASVFSQEGSVEQLWEWVIGINGHGSDGGAAYATTKSLLTSLAAQIPQGCSVRLVNLPTVKGKVEALNTMVKTCTNPTAPWVALLDCDDIWQPSKLAAQAAALAGPAAGADVIGTGCHYFGERNMVGPLLPSGWIPTDAWQQGNPLLNSSVLLRRELAHWEDRFGLEDYDLWIRLSRAGIRMYNLPEPLLLHRLHAASAFNGKGRQDVEGLRQFYLTGAGGQG
jgi:glycosyltransferase involved in cell wall biosynthesis